MHMAVYRHAYKPFKPEEYYGEWRWVPVFHEREEKL